MPPAALRQPTDTDAAACSRPVRGLGPQKSTRHLTSVSAHRGQTVLMLEIGQVEPCDWCGRPGTIRRHTYWRDGELVCRAPSLCDVCEFPRSLPGEVLDAIYKWGLDYDAVEATLQLELEAKWREKVERGERTLLADDEQMGPVIEVSHDH